MKGLYAILDVDAWSSRGVALLDEGVLEDVAAAVLAVGPAALQLRHKHGASRDVLAALRRLRAVVGTVVSAVPLVANDRADLGRLAGADVVHVGQDDLAVADVRLVAPGLRVGLSTHDHAQVEAALASAPAGRPDYLAFGPVFATTSKERPDPTVGVSAVRAVATRCAGAGVPLVAIGGISHETLPSLVDAGVRCAAVISALVAAVDGRPDLHEVEARARALHEALGA